MKRPSFRSLLLSLTVGLGCALASTPAARAQATPEAPGNAEEIERLVTDLIDDDRRFNALRALRQLRRIGEPANEALERALHSDDLQQRQLAAHLLRRQKGYRPHALLFEVSVEALRDDPISWFQSINNSAGATSYLHKHAHAARWYLVDGVRSDDGQQRFLSALVLARAGVVDAIDETTAILIEHLADNDIRRDACLACRALFLLGEPALPYLEPHRQSPDLQQRNLIELIIRDIHDPPQTREEEKARSHLNQITRHFHDPCVRSGWRIPGFLGDRNRLRRRGDIRRGLTPLPSLVPLRREHGHRLYTRLEAYGSDHQILGIGLRRPETFERLLTLRVYDDGMVQSWQAHPGGEGFWALEKHPDPEPEPDEGR